MSIAQQIIARLLTDESFRMMVQTYGETALKSYNLTADQLAVITHLNLEKWSSEITRMLAHNPLGGVRVR